MRDKRKFVIVKHMMKIPSIVLKIMFIRSDMWEKVSQPMVHISLLIFQYENLLNQNYEKEKSLLVNSAAMVRNKICTKRFSESDCLSLTLNFRIIPSIYQNRNCFHDYDYDTRYHPFFPF